MGPSLETDKPDLNMYFLRVKLPWPPNDCKFVEILHCVPPPQPMQIAFAILNFYNLLMHRISACNS